jgi:FMN-dependent NADH-azoreductase
MMTDDEIGQQIRDRGLEEDYIRELMATLGFDPADGFTVEGIEALDNAPMEIRRRAAMRTLALGAGPQA